MTPLVSSARFYTQRLGMLIRGAPLSDLHALPPEMPPGNSLVLEGRGEVFYRDMAGPSDQLPLLLLHGWLASAEVNWFGVFPALAGQRRVIALDHRGHGRGIRSGQPFRLIDCAEDAAMLLQALEIPEAIVAGYSMGGPIALLMAQRHPKSVAGLVTMASAAKFNGSLFEDLRWRSLPLLEIGVRSGLEERLVRRLAFELGQTNESLAAHSTWLAAELSRTDPAAAREAGEELRRFDATSWLSTLNIPAVAAITEHDSLVPPERQRALAEGLGAPMIVIPEADHQVPVQNPDALAAALNQAVAQVSQMIQNARAA